ncbi:hypothetical protein GOBAR_DD07977 [Gossypium barbadense]|nr:hypothetical protein GOBAR_DD07977 [Gossypium barbadense]
MEWNVNGKGNGNGQTPFLVYPDDANGIPKISLPVFGMGCYKLKGSIWTQNGVSERQHANSIMQVTENWLKQLQNMKVGYGSTVNMLLVYLVLQI